MFCQRCDGAGKMAQDYGAPIRIVESVAAANANRKRIMANKVFEACGGSVYDKTIAILGLAFKPIPMICVSHHRLISFLVFRLLGQK